MVALRCKIKPGAFSGEYWFEVPCEDGMPHTGVAWTGYFRTLDGDPITNLSGETDGLIAARILNKQNGRVLVSIPDGEVIYVKDDDVRPYPEPCENVPVGS